jgi:hypothetical protein
MDHDLKSNIQVSLNPRGRMQTRFEKKERDRKKRSGLERDRGGAKKIKQDFLVSGFQSERDIDFYYLGDEGDPSLRHVPGCSHRVCGKLLYQLDREL